jgi:hypothetical protein
MHWLDTPLTAPDDPGPTFDRLIRATTREADLLALETERLALEAPLADRGGLVAQPFCRANPGSGPGPGLRTVAAG